MQKRKRIIILDDIIDSCRLMPTIIQSFFFFLGLLFVTFFLQIGLFYFLYVVILIQVVFILLLGQKNRIYRRISKIENAIQLQILWVKTKKDERILHQKRFLNFILSFVSILILYYYDFTNIKFIIILALFSLLFFLKIIFYVPVLNIRIVQEEGMFQVSNEAKGESVEFQLYEMNSIDIYSNKIRIASDKDYIDAEMDFISNKERSKVYTFLKGLKICEVNIR